MRQRNCGPMNNALWITPEFAGRGIINQDRLLILCDLSSITCYESKGIIKIIAMSPFPSQATNRGELRFRIFGVPVRVQPLFWLSTILLGYNSDPRRLLLWISVCFFSILIHEMGHVAAFRAFGEDGEVILYGLGGLAIPTRRTRPRTAFSQVIISAAGPAAGFCAAAVVSVVAISLGAKMSLGFNMMIPFIGAQFPRDVITDRLYQAVAINELLYVNFYWGLVNLLPIYPLDGGHVSSALFTVKNGVAGFRYALILSAIVAGTLALLGWYAGSVYVTCMFGLLALGSVQTIRSMPRAPRQE